MKAWQFTNTHEPLALNEIPEPEPGPGEVVLDIKAAGLCHSDVGVLDDPGWLATIPTRPVTMGHEVAGVVTALGEGVTEWKIGDRVGVCPTGESGVAPGYGRDGGFTFKHRVHAGDLVRMPDELSFELAAMGTDAGMTSYHAVMVRGGLQAGQKVGIIGLGGLGQVGARIAVVQGAEVHVAEINEEAWPLAKEIGAVEVVKDASAWAGQGFDLVVDFAGFDTLRAATKALRRNGRAVLVGMGKLEFTLDTMDMILSELDVVGSNGGTPEDVAACYELFASGEVTPVHSVIGFEDIPEGIEKLRRGEVRGRLVAKIAD